MDWEPAEGWVTEEEDQRHMDPLGIRRLRHDIAPSAIQALIEKQAPLLRSVLLQPETVLNQAERLKTPDGHVRVVNKVCTILTKRMGADEHSLGADEESEYAKKKQNPEQVRRAAKFARRGRRGRGLSMANVEAQWEDLGEDAFVVGEKPVSTGGSKHQQPPSQFSLKWWQRCLLPLGYGKNSVATALSIRYVLLRYISMLTLAEDTPNPGRARISSLPRAASSRRERTIDATTVVSSNT